jgi:hypothetical protein
MRVELYANQEINDGVYNEATIVQNDVEFLEDFAEVILQFSRSVGYTYVKQVVFVKYDGDEVASDL